MFNHAPRDYCCPLCCIARRLPTDRGDQEPDVVLRNRWGTAFIAGKWWRSNPGHVIVIPNDHIENLYDLPAPLGHAIFDLSKMIAIALREEYRCAGTSVRQHNEPAGNQDVWHYHVHVFPRYSGDNLYRNHGDTFWPSADERRPYAERLRRFFGISGSAIAEPASL
jgi:histidine triad (HIT) family protein